MSDVNFPHYQQVQPVRDVTGDSFSKGQINFKWGQWGSQSRWNPYKSYFKIRVKITKGDAAKTQPDVAFGLAPSMFMADNLFQKVCQKINDITVSEQNDYVAQVAALKKRMAPKSWLDSVYKTNYSEPTFRERQARIVSDVENMNLLHKQLDLTALGFTVAQNTFAVIVSTGVCNFLAAGGAIPDIREVLKVGDVIEFGTQGNLAHRRTITVISFISALSFQGASGIVQTASTAETLANNGLKVFRSDITNNIVKYNAENGVNDIEVIWKPCLGFWSYNGWIPSAEFNFVATPHPNLTYMRYAVEALTNLEPIRLDGDNINSFKVEIVNMLMYAYVGQVDKSPGNMDISYPETRMQSQNLTTHTLTQKTFVINPHSYALTLAYQSSEAGEDVRFSRSKFRIREGEELNITRFYLRRGQQELPSPYPDTDIRDVLDPGGNKIGRRQYIAQIYAENLMYSGMYFNSGGQEDINDFIERGLYYHYNFDGKNMDERVYVSQQFSKAFTNNPQILLFDHFIRHCKLEMRNGEVHKVWASEIN